MSRAGCIARLQRPGRDRFEAIRLLVELELKVKKMNDKNLESLLAGILSEPPLISTNVGPSPPTSFDEDPDDAERERGEVATRADQDLLPEQKNVSAADKDIPEALKIDDVEMESLSMVQTLAEQILADTPDDAEDLAVRAEQAKSLLAGLDLDTAISLRWAMRDIRGKRTKLSPVSDNDLAALMDLGFVEIKEEIPRLTGLGVLVLD